MHGRQVAAHERCFHAADLVEELTDHACTLYEFVRIKYLQYHRTHSYENLWISLCIEEETVCKAYILRRM
jgi:hypothetical protein